MLWMVRRVLGRGLYGVLRPGFGRPAGRGGRGFRLAGLAAVVQAAVVAAGYGQAVPVVPVVPAVPLRAFDPALRDMSVDPCSDFYAYACGNWLKQNPIPADRSSYGRDTEVQDANERTLRAILEKAAAGVAGNAARTDDEQKIGDAYAACMDTSAIDAAGVKPLQPLLAKIDAVRDKAELPAVLAELEVHGVPGLFQFGAQQDDRDATKEIAYVGQAALGLPEKGYYDRTDQKSAELRQEYVNHVRRVFVLLGEGEQQAGVDANTVLRVETALAAASLSNVEMRDPTKLYHLTPLAQFVENSPGLALAGYLKGVGAPAVPSLNVAEPVYFLSLQEFLEGAKLEDVKTYLRWNVERAAEDTALAQPLDDENFSFYGKVLNGVPEQKPRWKRCAETVDEELGEALGRVYVEQRFSAADKTRVRNLTIAIEDAADGDIDSLGWMSKATKVEAKQKLHLIANNIGYPDKWRDYSGLKIVRDDAAGNAERAARFEVERETRKIGRPVDRGEWQMTPPTVNAYYDPQMNSINFPAGILQPPYFDATQDDAVNDGAAGAVIGHELTHGFDDEGRQFDGYGNLRDWWRKDDAKEFAARAQCVEEEYSGFVAVDTLHVNGKLTLGENLADLAGLRLAWLAYAGQSAGAAAGKAGVGYGGLTPAQQFFSAYGQSWCANTRPEAMRERTQVDPHAPEKYRVNGVLANMPAFAEAFQCKAGAPMVAVKRCQLW